MTTYDTLYDTATMTRREQRKPASWLGRVWADYSRRRHKRRVALSLLSLDDRLLRDIGIEPIDVIDAANGRFGPSVLLNPMRRKDHE